MFDKAEELKTVEALEERGFDLTDHSHIGKEFQRIKKKRVEKVVVDLNGRARLYMPTKPTKRENQRLRHVKSKYEDLDYKK